MIINHLFLERRETYNHFNTEFEREVESIFINTGLGFLISNNLSLIGRF